MQGRTIMTRAAVFFSILLLVLTSCDSSSGLADEDLVGQWDGVGALQSSADGNGITLFIESHVGGDGPLTGSWRRSQDFLSQGSIAAGVVQNGEVTFRLSGFPGTDPTFVGELTNKHRLEGDFSDLPLEGAAVFRRRSVVP
jgi:hypothetical protein